MHLKETAILDKLSADDLLLDSQQNAIVFSLISINLGPGLWNMNHPRTLRAVQAITMDERMQLFADSVAVFRAKGMRITMRRMGSRRIQWISSLRSFHIICLHRMVES